MPDTEPEPFRHGPWRGNYAGDLYPGLVVHDGRQSGSITVGDSRLPLWAFAGWDWDQIVAGWDYIETDYGWTREKHRRFHNDLLNLRGDFARLLLVLADAERCGRRAEFGRAWWETKRHRKRVAEALLYCLDVVTDPDDEPSPATQARKVRKWRQRAEASEASEQVLLGKLGQAWRERDAALGEAERLRGELERKDSA